MDNDSPWEEDPKVDHVPEAEWTKITSEFTNTGYREGIIAGKEAFLQAGFDAGFADVGVPLGRELGKLRGVAAAIGSFLNSQNPNSLDLEELHAISAILSTIHFSDIVPPDLEAEQHAKEHLGVDELATVEHTESMEAEMESQKKRATEDVANAKERLALLSVKLALPVLV
ncbi:hypothetical protein JVU11DRAFT_3045 [Chiua virens]|nr:hypothetical protein JVU11DRAFT_3045 [Chiua virens]